MTADGFPPLIAQVKLTTLDVGNNMIEKIENVTHLVNLVEFWVSFLTVLPFDYQLMLNADSPLSPPSSPS